MSSRKKRAKPVLERLREFLLTVVKYRYPSFWRRHWGYPVPQGTRFEDYCENLRPVSLPKDVLGRQGEKYVFDKVVTSTNCRVIACNTENYYCEIDLVFLDDVAKEIVFVEVKTRRYGGTDFRPEEFSIDAKRKKKLALAGRAFMHERGYTDYKDRYDVAVVIMSDGVEPVMRYHRAFFTYLDAVKGYRLEDFGKKRSDRYLRDDLRNRRRSDGKP